MSKIIIACDSGKNLMKAIGKDIETGDVKRISFPSKIAITNDESEEYEGNSHMISIGEQNYILGEAGSNYDFDTSKTKDLHKLSIYTCICKLLKPGTKDNKVNIVLACPLDFMGNKDLKNEYKNFIWNEGKEINCKVDGDDYSFVIEDITIKQEGSGVIYNSIDIFNGKSAAVIDLGGQNFSFCIYNNCVPDKSTRFSRDFGGNYLINECVNKLRVYTKGKAISTQLALKSLKEDVLTLANAKDSKSIDEIQNIKKDYLYKIIDEIKKAGQNVDVVEPYFCGGTTELLKETILKEIPFATVVKNPQWESIEGLFVIANNKYSIGDGEND